MGEAGALTGTRTSRSMSNTGARMGEGPRLCSGRGLRHASTAYTLQQKNQSLPRAPEAVPGQRLHHRYFAKEMSDFLKSSELTQTRAFIRSFVRGIEVRTGKAAIVYSIPTPEDSPIEETDATKVVLNGRVRSTVQNGEPCGIRTHDTRIKSPVLFR